MTALLLSAGGMFGAYQAGAWRALAGRIRFDLIIGASIGAINAWAIAGGAEPDELIRYWLDPEGSRMALFRLIQPPWRGCFDARPVHARIEKMWGDYRPRTQVAIVATEIPALRPRIFRDTGITWRHLAASCAVLACYPQIRLDGRWYSDGGLLGALPLWAASELGADRVVAINVLPKMPSMVVRTAVKTLQRVAPARPAPAAGLEVHRVEPAGGLGSLRQAVFWNRQAVEAWIARGEADARRLRLE